MILIRPSRRAPICTRALRSATLLLGLALGLALGPVAPPAASAATLMVVGDTNAAPAANMPLYTHFLGTATSVLFSRNNSAQTRLWSDYRAMPGVTVAQSAAPLTAAALAAVDLLVLSAVYDAAMSYADPEMVAASAFLMAGGKVLMIAEAQNAAAIVSYNAVLARLGSAIRYPGARFSSSEKIDVTGATGLLAGLTRFSVAKYNTLAGGRSLIVAANGPVVMTERPGAPPPVPLPAGLVQLAGALAALAAAGAASAGRGRRPGCATGASPAGAHLRPAAALRPGSTGGLAL